MEHSLRVPLTAGRTLEAVDMQAAAVEANSTAAAAAAVEASTAAAAAVAAGPRKAYTVAAFAVAVLVAGLVVVDA